ncbi:MAG: hypothetical protein R3C68_10140 [Myxococcota bacterium]
MSRYRFSITNYNNYRGVSREFMMENTMSTVSSLTTNGGVSPQGGNASSGALRQADAQPLRISNPSFGQQREAMNLVNTTTVPFSGTQGLAQPKAKPVLVAGLYDVERTTTTYDQDYYGGTTVTTKTTVTTYDRYYTRMTDGEWWLFLIVFILFLGTIIGLAAAGVGDHGGHGRHGRRSRHW